jgi:predicted Rossmann-fold nucleotide-binding protein
MIGMVSAAALEAGGYVHGIIPESLVERASQTGNGLKSGEGQGVDILDNDYDGRFTTEMTQGMHEVSESRVWEGGKVEELMR